MNYARVPDLASDLNAQAQGASVDAVRQADAIAEASKAFETMTSRRFYSAIETRYFSGRGCRELWLDCDLLSITTLKLADTADQPSAFENTLTDYTLWPRNAAPYRKIILNPAGQFGAFPVGVDNVQIVGSFGYSDMREAVVGLAAVTITVANGTGLTLTASENVADLVAVGDTLWCEDEEMGDVVSVSSVSIVVRERGINGTTGVAHSAKALYLRRYPRDVERAVRADAARYLWRASQGMPANGEFREMWPAIAMAANSYADPASVI